MAPHTGCSRISGVRTLGEMYTPCSTFTSNRQVDRPVFQRHAGIVGCHHDEDVDVGFGGGVAARLGPEEPHIHEMASKRPSEPLDEVREGGSTIRTRQHGSWYGGARTTEPASAKTQDGPRHLPRHGGDARTVRRLKARYSGHIGQQARG